MDDDEDKGADGCDGHDELEADMNEVEALMNHTVVQLKDMLRSKGLKLKGSIDF
jgi:hypothetical protein